MDFGLAVSAAHWCDINASKYQIYKAGYFRIFSELRITAFTN